MTKSDNDKIKKLIHRIGLKYNLRDEDVNKIITSPYIYVRQIITNMEIEENITEDEFNKLKTNFIFPNIGKLYIKYGTVLRYQNQKKHDRTK